MKFIFLVVAAGCAIVNCGPAYANDDLDVDMDASNRVMEMIVDLGGHDMAEENSGKIFQCDYKGTKKITIKNQVDLTTFTGEYRNCRENGTIRDGIYEIFAEGSSIIDSTSRRSVNGELFDAVAAGDEKKVRSLIKAKADVNYTESIKTIEGGYIKEWTPLMSAVLSDNLKMVKLLVASGAWVNYMNGQVFNAFWLAANNGKLDIVTFLAEHGAIIDNRNIEEVNPIMAAAMNGHLDVVKYLVGRKAKLNLKHQGGETALTFALETRHPDVAKLLINSGADISISNNSGVTALMVAANEGNEDIVRLLLEKGADTMMKSASGKTALDYALLKGNLTIVELLKKAVR